MSTITNPTEEFKPGRKRRGVIGFFSAALALSAVGAASAAVWSVNEVESTWELTDCLTKTAGEDSDNFGADPTDTFYINFDPTATEVDPATGVAVLQETLDVRAPAGFRTYSTDTFHVAATGCGYDFTIRLNADAVNSFGEAAVEGNWADKGVSLYLSLVANPGDDFSNAAEWDQTPLVVNNAGVIVNATTGDAVLVDDSELVIGFQLAGGSPAGALGTFRFQVQFFPTP